MEAQDFDYELVADAFSSDEAHKQRMIGYFEKRWFIPSTPIRKNAVRKVDGKFQFGIDLPIACFIMTLKDTIRDIIDKTSEARWLSVSGGGLALNFNSVREPDLVKSPGAMAFIKTLDVDTGSFRQGSTRRGAYAVYMDIDHPQIMEFIQMRDKAGDHNLKCFNLNHGINITNKFIEACRQDADWHLYSRDHNRKGEIVKTMKARELWVEILKVRKARGEPYLHNIDASNAALPAEQKDKGLKITSSNLCFSGDTLVATADGRNAVSIKDLADFSQGVLKFPVYSGRPSGGHNEIEVKNAIAFKNGTKQLIKVCLSDGTSFRCTPDHEIQTLDMRWIEAKDSIGESLYPFYSTDGVLKNLVNPNRVDSFVVTSIEDDAVEDVYDLTVDDNHNFFIITAGDKDYRNSTGVLVSNCTEIVLPNDYTEEAEDQTPRTSVCCVASINVEKHSEYLADIDEFVGDCVEFLDNVIEVFILGSNDRPELKNANYSARMERALSLGAVGFHSYLQSLNIAFESPMAKGVNRRVFSQIKNAAYKRSLLLGQTKGVAPDVASTGRRNSVLTAIAPTHSSADVVKTSPGIEPLRSNIFIQRTDTCNIRIVNKWLRRLLVEKDQFNDEVVESIVRNDGSVQHLDFLSEYEKDVFKTAMEIDSNNIVDLAIDRQEFIDQAQSVNTFAAPEDDIEYLHSFHWRAMIGGLKTLYYMKSKQGHRASVPEFNKDPTSCIGCEG